MNTPRPPRSTDAHPVDERDWLAQERALTDPSGDRRDAVLARALRTMPVSRPPADFAAEVARLAAAGVRTPATDDARLERGLLRALLVLLALAGLGAAAYYGSGWWALAQEALGGGAARWALVGAACLLLSWLPEMARRLGESTRDTAPA
ncbi:MAG TPA: hypothetical protein PK743_12515 [Luteimonas sp.]|nr:hypothetical protein [Luteimonas sp.]